MVDEVRFRLKALRNKIGLRAREVAEGLGMPLSSYQKFEDRRRGTSLPLAMVAELVLILQPLGAHPAEVWVLADPAEIAVFHTAWAANADGTEMVALPDPEQPVDVAPTGTGRSRRLYERWNPMPARYGVNGSREPCVVKDISPSGACIVTESTDQLTKDAEVSLELSGFGQLSAIITRIAGSEIGLNFDRRAEADVAAWLAPMRGMRH